MSLKIKTEYTIHITITGPWDERPQAIRESERRGFNEYAIYPDGKGFILKASKPTPKGP